MMRKIFPFTVVLLTYFNSTSAQTSGVKLMPYISKFFQEEWQDKTLVSAPVVDCNATSTGLTPIIDLEAIS